MASFTPVVARGFVTVTGTTPQVLYTAAGDLLLSSFRIAMELTTKSGTPEIYIQIGSSGAGLCKIFRWFPDQVNAIIPSNNFQGKAATTTNYGRGMIDLLEARSSSFSVGALGPHNALGLKSGDTIQVICDTAVNVTVVQWDLVGQQF